MWEIDIGKQMLSFGIAIILGGGLCFFYGLFSATRRALCYGKWIVFIQDIIFFSVSAVITFVFLTALTNGEVRGFFVIGELAGFFIIKFTLFNPFVFLIIKVILFMKQVLDNINNTFCKILDIIYTFIDKKLKKLQKNS